MSNDTWTIVHEWFEQVWNQANPDAIDALLAADAVVHGLKDDAGNTLRGPEGFKPLYAKFRNAFPDIRIDIEDCVREGDKIAFRCVVRGTHLGDALGISATRRGVEFAGMGFVRVEGDKIAEAWNTFDFQDMLAQIGG